MWGPPRGGGRRTRLALAAVVAALLAATTLALALGPQDAAGLADRSSSVELLTLTVSGIYKLGFYLYKEERFRSLLGVLRRVVEDGDGGDVGAVTARKFAVMYCVSGHVIVTFWCLAPLLDASITGTKVGLPVNGRSLADRGDDPGGVTPGVVFGLEYLLHCLTLFCSAHIYLACDVLFFSVLHAVGLRLQEVNASLRRIGTYSQVDDENTALRACYQHHSDIMELLTGWEKLFRPLLVSDMLHAIVSLSFAILHMSESKSGVELVKDVVFIFYCILHQFLNSYFGEKLLGQQAATLDAVYDTGWERRGDVVFSKRIILVAMRATRPVTISAWRMYYLRFSSFKEFLSTMISYYMVLKELVREKET